MRTRGGGSASAKKRRRRNERAARQGFGLGYALLTVLLAAVVTIVAFTVFFKIQKIEVTGNAKYSAEEIIAAAGFQKGDNLYLFDKYGKINLMFTKLPYLQDIRVRRRLPDTLLIEVSETKPALKLSTADGVWLADERGKLLELIPLGENPSVLEGLIEVKGLQLAAPRAGQPIAADPEGAEQPLFELLTAFTKYEILGKVDSIDLSLSYDLQFEYDGRFTVRAGLPEKLEYKVIYLIETVKRLDSYSSGSIDLTGDKIRFIPSSPTSTSTDSTTSTDSAGSTDSASSTP